LVAVFLGELVAPGQRQGRISVDAGDVVVRPISPKDIMATTLHLLSIDPQTTIEDRLGPPVLLLPGGSVIAEALA
jgi:hypothetical protein